jgi:hypothetical protein
MQIHTIPEKMTSTWADDVKAVVDTWQNYHATLEEFKESVLEKGINHAKANGGVAWIVDSSQAKGAFPQEIQAFIASDVFPAFVKNGIKYFITINSQVSAITNMTVSSFSAKAGPLGLKLLELNSADDAKEWLKANA